MADSGMREVEHEVTVQAPVDVVYQLVAAVADWPNIFPPNVHVEHLESGPGWERIQMWATVNGGVETWTSVRILDPQRHRVEFRQETSHPPVASMGGAWIVEALSEKSSRIRLQHHYRAVDDAPDSLSWIDKAVDTNSHAELAAMKSEAEQTAEGSRLKLTIDDTVQIHSPAAKAYDFVNQAQLWSERLPHVSTVRMEEDTPGLQLLEMDTRTKDGSTHTTKSIRVCVANDRIAYKQIVLPPLMTLHTGLWTFTENNEGVTATSRHTAVINPENITKLLGEQATVDDARDYVRQALSTNSLSTLGYAKAFAESHS